MSDKRKIYLRRVESNGYCQGCYFFEDRVKDCSDIVVNCSTGNKDYIYKEISEKEYREARK
jgi:hypothetical protein